MELSKGGRALLQGRGAELDTVETEGQMIQRVMPDLMGMKNIWALNDEGHHCYRHKPGEDDEGALKGDDKERSRQEQRGRPRLDIRARDRQAAIGRQTGSRSVGDPLLLAGLRLCRGNPVPLDRERLLAHGRHRERHRQAAARSGGRQHSRR